MNFTCSPAFLTGCVIRYHKVSLSNNLLSIGLANDDDRVFPTRPEGAALMKPRATPWVVVSPTISQAL